MHLATKNILTFQEVARERIDNFLTSNDYKIVLNEWDKEGLLPCHTESPPASEAGSEVSQYDFCCGCRVFF